MTINRTKWATVVGLSALVAIAGATAIQVSGGAGIPGLTTTSASAGQGNAGAGNSGKGAPPVAAGSGMEQVSTQHIIVFHEAALAGYEGERAGFPAPPRVTGAKGKRRIDVNSAQARNYVKFLQQAQAGHEARMAQVAGRPLKVRLRMQHALNGMVAELTSDEAARIAQLPGVALVEAYREYAIHSDTGPIHIGAGPVWDGTNPGASGKFQGEGVVVGILDTGINFGSPSFAGVDPIDGYQHVNPRGAGNYLGTCAPGGVDEGRCNDKLIGGYDFVCGPPGNSCGQPTLREEPGFGDTNNHGSHVASTAAGNRRDANFAGGVRRISGVAPRANIVAFDICHTVIATGGGSCPSTSSAAAIDQAVADGVVDVLNYSIGGGASPWSEAVSLAFLNAVNAGIYVATSAGNSGPGPNTMGHLQPWTASTAAAQHGRGAFSSLLQITGPGVVPEPLKIIILTEGSGGVPHSAEIPASTPLLVSPGIDTANDGCVAYPANAFQGAIAMVRRGTCGFAVKANFARDAGAIAVVIANNQAGVVAPSVPGTTTPVFSVVQTDGDAIRDFAAANQGTTAKIGYPPMALPNVADALAAFSSRGPAGILDLLKPDVTAPGVSILAVLSGTTLTGNENLVGLLSGTSMASPHHAGAAALVRQAQPLWTAPEIKSALMMTATQAVFKEDTVTAATPFDRGAGRIQVDKAVRAGLVMNETKARYLAANPATGGDPSALNQPSLQKGRCIERCVFTRTFRNTLSFRQAWTAKVEGLSGSVSPSLFTVNPGESRTVTITINSFSVPQTGAFSFGSVVLQPQSIGNPNQPVLRLPVAVAVPPPAIALLPETVSVVATAGSNTVANIGIGNAGGARLDFTVGNTGTGIATVIDAPSAGGNGFRSTSYTDPSVAGNPGQYASEDFTLANTTKLTTLSTAGFTVNGLPLLGNATSLTWSIYPDAAGKPAGNPQTSPGAALWTYTAATNAAGVSTTGNTIGLNLTTAGQVVNLPPGKYWLVVHARTSFANRWVWFVSNTGDGLFNTITPGTAGTGVWTAGTGAAGLNALVRGDVSCGAAWMGAATPSMGQVTGGTSMNVQVQLNTSGLAPGSYSAYACFASNDPIRPKAAARVALTITP